MRRWGPWSNWEWQYGRWVRVRHKWPDDTVYFEVHSQFMYEEDRLVAMKRRKVKP